MTEPLLVPRKEGFDLIGVGNTKGHELINRGVLEVKKIDGKTLITMRSLKRVAEEGASRDTEACADTPPEAA